MACSHTFFFSMKKKKKDDVCLSCQEHVADLVRRDCDGWWQLILFLMVWVWDIGHKNTFATITPDAMFLKKWQPVVATMLLPVPAPLIGKIGQHFPTSITTDGQDHITYKTNNRSLFSFFLKPRNITILGEILATKLHKNIQP